MSDDWTQTEIEAVLDHPSQKIGPDERVIILRMLRIGSSRRMAAKMVDVHPSTLRAFVKRNSRFAAEMKEAEGTAYKSWLMRMHETDDWRAAQWMLKCKHPDEFSEVTKIAQTDAKGRDLTPEQRGRVIDSIIRKKLGDDAELLIPQQQAKGIPTNGHTNGNGKR